MCASTPRKYPRSGYFLVYNIFPGLDPAKPYFDLVSEEARLLPTDATFVDVIHTNSGEIWDGALSLPEPVGQVDFYPNGGSHQAGCTAVCIGSSCINIDLVDLFGNYSKNNYIP